MADKGACPKCGEVVEGDRPLVSGSGRETYFKERNQQLRIICQKVIDNPTYLPSIEESICFQDWYKLDEYLAKRITDMKIDPPAPLCEMTIKDKIDVIIKELLHRIEVAEGQCEECERGRS
jgi:hypothetical protein